MVTAHRERIVFSVGGSLVVPNGGIGIDFLSKFNKFIRSLLAEDNSRQFFLVVGGGATTRHYQDGARKVIGHELTSDDLDWLGIHATRLNAHLVKTIFRDIAHPYIIKNYDIIRKATEPVVVASGWKPGWSTDYDAVLLCEDYRVDTIINLSNINKVCDKDPRINSDAKEIDRISWREYRKLVGEEWIPGMHAPFDPIAAKRAEELGIKVIIVNGNDLTNLEKCVRDEKFIGTVIE